MKLGERIAERLDVCKTHWREIFAISFLLHFVMDGFVFLAGYLMGKYL